MPRPAPPLGTRKINNRGYVIVWQPSHPRARCGYIYEHILIAEKAIGRYITRENPIHHANEIKSDNRPCNLVVCENKA